MGAMLVLLGAGAMLATWLLWLSSILPALAKLPASLSCCDVVLGAPAVFLSVPSAMAAFSPEFLPALSTQQGSEVKA